jgi:SAM-dependent methyltransferase
VIAADLPGWTDHDYPRWYLKEKLARVPPETLRQIDDEQVHGPFELAHDILGSRVGRLRSTVYDLPRRVRGAFDFVVLSHVLAHLRDPVGALEAVADVLKPDGVAVIAASIESGSPEISAALFVGSAEEICWWIPTAAGLDRWCRMAGLDSVVPVGQFRLETLRGPKSIAMIRVVHARRTR